MTRAGAWALALALLAGAPGCAARKTVEQAGEGPDFGVYRATLARPSDERHFRLLLFAALPDRLHAEVLPPVGSPSLVLDAGEGRISVLSSRDHVAYVGDAKGDALRKAIGVDTTVGALVRAIVSGEVEDAGVAIERDPPQGPGLPRRLLLHGDAGSLELTLVKIRKSRGDDAGIGRGAPPAGVTTRPLEDLPELDVEAER